jgi:hypothetical protein
MSDAGAQAHRSFFCPVFRLPAITNPHHANDEMGARNLKLKELLVTKLLVKTPSNAEEYPSKASV